MAFLYQRSRTWRKIVDLTRRSPLYLALFAGACVGGPMLLGDQIMNKTNPRHETDLERQLRAKSGMHDQARALHGLCVAGWETRAAAALR